MRPMRRPRPGARLSVVGVMVGCLFAAMFVRLWYLQILDAPSFQAAATSNQVRPVTEPAPRGLIVDRTGRTVVDNRTVVAITLSRDAAAKHPAVIDQLATLLGMNPADIRQKLGDPRFSPYKPVPVATNVDIAKVVYVREHQDQFPGVAVAELSQRDYPDTTAAAHILGYVGDASAADLARLKGQGYQQGDLVGKAGVEKVYEQWLRGVPGVTNLEVDARGRVLGTIGQRRPVAGDDVQLTIDVGLQQTVEADLANEIGKLQHTFDPLAGIYFPAPSGAAIVMDPRDGSILAMSSYPTYDPSVWVGGISSQEYQSLSDPASHYPLINRAVEGLYTPGSTFKLVTSTAALDDGLIGPNTIIDDPGEFTIPHCTGQCSFHNAESEALGPISVVTAITASDDVFFYTLGYRFYAGRSQFGPEPIQDMAHAYGLGEPTEFPLGGAAQGRVDSPSERRFLHDHYPQAFPNYGWYAGDNVEVAFGQGATVVSPLQLADAYAAFANGGTVWQPHVAARVVDRSGKVVDVFKPKALSHVTYAPGVHDTILEGLKGVVANRRGTAYGTFLGFPDSQFPVAAKTGTATTSSAGNKEPTALFVAFAPADNPQYLVAVVIDEAGYGASGAAPVARQILEYLIQHPVGPVQSPPAPGAAQPAGSPTPSQQSTSGSTSTTTGGTTTTTSGTGGQGGTHH
ncbi:MAG TPA: penicillin-binding protein 2 [Acidimicrobiales bacterium]|nr:penicillin-binding protein 2 [Acidimicrobiales bacterium]